MLIMVIGVLSIILAFEHAPYVQLSDPAWTIAAVAAATVIPFGVAGFVSRRSIRLLERNPADPGIGQFAYGRGLTIVQWLLGAAHALVLLTTDWMDLCHEVPIIGEWALVPGLLAGVPLLASITMLWIAAYPADRAIREIALETHLFRGQPTQPVWSLGKYLAFNFRHQVFIVLVPMLLILAARDLILMYRMQIRSVIDHDFAPDLLLGGTAGLVAVIAPLLLRHIWVTAPLPQSPLRDQLERLCKKLRLRCREILVWNSSGMITNAAVMGVIAPLRYVLITDAMLEQMDDRKVEAVFGHEAGHVKRHHILFFLLFALISGCLITIMTHRLQGVDRLTYQIVTAVAGVLLMLKWGFLFGFVSRAFERQADLFGVYTLELTGLPCSGACAIHAPADEQANGDQQPICRTAAHLFSETLNEVAILNNIPGEAWSWRHGSIASRSRILQKYANDPSAVAAFEHSVWRMKLAIFTMAVVAVVATIWDLELWRILIGK